MLLEVSPEGYGYLNKLRNIVDPTDEDDERYMRGLKPSSAKSETEAEDEMVLSLYSNLGPKSDSYFSEQIPGTDDNTRGLFKGTVRRLYEEGYLVNAEEGVII
jgi:hypothetical protein